MATGTLGNATVYKAITRHASRTDSFYGPPLMSPLISLKQTSSMRQDILAGS